MNGWEGSGKPGESGLISMFLFAHEFSVKAHGYAVSCSVSRRRFVEKFTMRQMQKNVEKVLDSHL